MNRRFFDISAGSRMPPNRFIQTFKTRRKGRSALDYRATLLLYAELLFALAILWREGLLDTRRRRVFAIGLVSLAFVLRYCCLTYETLDYQDWIHVWLTSLREAGPWAGLGGEIWSCNYNVPYLYFLAVIATSSIYELLLVKLTSILFDVILAWAVLRLVGVFTQSPARKLVAFIGTLWLPSVILNGALWGQCDVIYAAFAVLSVYLVLDNRPGWGVAAIAISISFKLQGIFLLPVFLVFVIARRVKLRHLLVFPLTYILTILPAVFAGRDFWELLTLYYNNTSTIGDGLNYNASSLYALIDFSSVSADSAALLGTFLAFGLCAAICVWFLIRRGEITDRSLLAAAAVFCVGVPFFLPHMHDRYFFMADVFTFALAVLTPVLAVPAALVSFGSLLGYHAYLRMRYLLPMNRGGAAMAAALAVLLGYTAYTLSIPEPAPAPAAGPEPEAEPGIEPTPKPEAEPEAEPAPETELAPDAAPDSASAPRKNPPQQPQKKSQGGRSEKSGKSAKKRRRR